MPKFNENIKEMAKQNTDFRRGILTNEHSQIVLMSIEPCDEIGGETHEVDQVLLFVKGRAKPSWTGKGARSVSRRWWPFRQAPSTTSSTRVTSR